MNYFLRVGAYILHPLLMPLIGVLLYFWITPKFYEAEIFQAKTLAVIILTVLMPIVLFYLLRNLRVISSIHLPEVSERKIPLLIQSILLVLIIKIVFDVYDSPELYYFFVGILVSTMIAFLMVILKFKASLHQMGIAGTTMFLVVLSVHFKVNLILWTAIFFIANGWVASSRLHTKSHTLPELIFGFFIGLLPQVILLPFWL